MRKIYKLLPAALALIILFALPVLAGTWEHDNYGWWWDNGDGTYPAGGWAWCDGDHDGIGECYYFDNNGYCLMNTVTPDGYQVNTSGAWVVNGAVQTQYVGGASGNAGQTSGGQSYGGSGQSSRGGQNYNLSGWQSRSTQDDGVEYGYLRLESGGSGVLRIGSGSPEYQISWSRSDDELHLNYASGSCTGYVYDELGQIRLVIGDYVYYFDAA